MLTPSGCGGEGPFWPPPGDYVDMPDLDEDRSGPIKLQVNRGNWEKKFGACPEFEMAT